MLTLEQEIELALWVQRMSLGIERDLKVAANQMLDEILASLAKTGAPAPERLQAIIDAIEQAASEHLAPALDEAMTDIQAMSFGVQTALVTKAKLKRVSDAWRQALESPIAATGDLLEPFVKGLESDAVDKLTRSIQSSMVKNLSHGFIERQVLDRKAHV